MYYSMRNDKQNALQFGLMQSLGRLKYLTSYGMPFVHLSACLDWLEEYPNVSTSELTGILTKWRRMDKVYERRFSESVHKDFKDERVDLQFADWKKL